MNNLTLYCNCFPQHENLKTQFNQKNLMCASASISQDYRNTLIDKGFFFDDSGDNISQLNPWFGDLTGLYWVWKNTSDEFVGTNQYRRFYDVDQINNIKFNEHTLYVSMIVGFTGSTATQYSNCHGQIGLDILKEAAIHKKIPFTENMIGKLYHISHMSPCNMFFAHRTLFDKMCQVLFDTIFELYNGSKYSLPYIQPEGQTRMIAFLAERICTLIYMYHIHFFGKTNIEYINYECGPK